MRAAAAAGAEGQGAGAAPARAHRWPTREHARKVLLLAGCVQPAMLPNINSATARVLDAAGIQTLVADDAGCCGAIRLHLNDHAGALDDMRRNIDAWWPLVAARRGRGDTMGRAYRSGPGRPEVPRQHGRSGKAENRNAQEFRRCRKYASGVTAESGRIPF